MKCLLFRNIGMLLTLECQGCRENRSKAKTDVLHVTVLYCGQMSCRISDWITTGCCMDSCNWHAWWRLKKCTAPATNSRFGSSTVEATEAAVNPTDGGRARRHSLSVGTVYTSHYSTHRHEWGNEELGLSVEKFRMHIFLKKKSNFHACISLYTGGT